MGISNTVVKQLKYIIFGSNACDISGIATQRGEQYFSCGRDLFHVPLHMTEVNDGIQGDVRQSLIHYH